jgi:hypothetical protein
MPRSYRQGRLEHPFLSRTVSTLVEYLRAFVWQFECDRSAGEVNERECGVGEPIRAADDQLHAVVHGLGAGVAQVRSRSISSSTVSMLRPGAKIARTVSFIAQARGTFPPVTWMAASVSVCVSVQSEGFFKSDQRLSLNAFAAAGSPA